MPDNDANGDRAPVPVSVPVDDTELLTVAECAAKLGTDVSILRRFLKRPHIAPRFEQLTRTEARATRTGTRTATLYPFPVVADVWNKAREGELLAGSTVPDAPNGDGDRYEEQDGERDRDQNRDRDRDTSADPGSTGQDAASVFTIPDERTRAYLQLLTKSYTDQIATQAQALKEQSKTIDDLRGDKARLLEEVAALKQITAAPVEAPAEIQNAPMQATGDTDTNTNTERVPTDAPTVPEAAQTRPWWRFW